MKATRAWWRPDLRSVCCVLLALFARPALGETKTFDRTFPAPAAEVERALRSLQAFATGKLPTLYGFVVTQEPNLENYSQAYYQHSITVRSTGAGETEVKVTAKITAWLTDDDAAKSGYRELTSNGRLELDLLDRLGRALGVPSPERKESAPTHGFSTERPPVGREHPVEPPTRASTSFSTLPPLAQSLPTRDQLPALTAKSNDEQRVQQLKKEIADLEDILRNQSRPSDLAAVRTSGVAVYDQPLETGQVLFRADAEDEFRVVEELGAWVHIQISGISRGWIQRANLEMPGANPALGSALQPHADALPLGTTREESALFPGDWTRLRGRKVKILWVSGTVSKADGGSWAAARSAFRKGMAGMDPHAGEEGIVVVFDSADGGMAATTLPDLQRWILGELSDEAFRKLCWLDPSDAF